MGLLATAHQPVYMPWLGLLHKIASADVFISWDDVQQEDSGFENRNQVLTAKGAQWLTVPCRRGRDLKIRQVEIAEGQPWKRKHFRTLELAYAKAPLWNEHAPFLERVYGEKAEWRNLVQVNEAILAHMLFWFRITRPRLFTLSGLGVPAGDAQQTIVAACRAVGANQYLFGKHGVDYANRQALLDGGVEPFVQDYDCKPYPQVGRAMGDFTSRLSALDLMMNVSRDEAIAVMMAGGNVRRMG